MKNLIKLSDASAHVALNDSWMLVAGVDHIEPGMNGIVPIACWLELAPAQRTTQIGVSLAPDDDPAQLEPWLCQLELIALEFPTFRDGRAYSQAYLLRQRYHFKGELRAVGDVLRDQLSHMRQCGFDSFAIREDRSAEDAVLGLKGMSVLYGRSVIEPRPLFRRGRA